PDSSNPADRWEVLLCDWSHTPAPETFAQGTIGRITCVTVSPDGKRLAAFPGTAGRQQPVRMVRVWDLVTRQERTFDGLPDRITSLGFSPDGRLMAAYSDDGTIYMWDVAGEQPPVLLRDHKHNTGCLAFSPDGRILAA